MRHVLVQTFINKPATSPTLSPTLSAIVPGLRGSSSGIPASIFPTKSAPTSAAFVKIPPESKQSNLAQRMRRSLDTCEILRRSIMTENLKSIEIHMLVTLRSPQPTVFQTFGKSTVQRDTGQKTRKQIHKPPSRANKAMAEAPKPNPAI